jgi:Mn2+/Fe2+ NRAMP family transporter
MAEGRQADERHTHNPVVRYFRTLPLMAGVQLICPGRLDGLGLNPVRMLFLSALLNGVLAPPLLVLVMLVGNDRRIMGDHVNTRPLNVLGWAATAVMALATLALVGVSVL